MGEVLTGKKLGHYEMGRVIGIGGMGVGYEAYEEVRELCGRPIGFSGWAVRKASDECSDRN